MSDTYTNTSGGADSYNEGAAHDTGFYDADRHDNQIVAVFKNRIAADRARDALVEAGVPGDQIQITAGNAGDAAPGVSEAEDKGVGDQILSAMLSLFTSGEEQHDFTHAVRQGHAMVVVVPTGDTDRHRVIQVLEQSDPIDFDAKLAEWRQAGYDRSGAPRSEDSIPPRRVGKRETPTDQAAPPSRVRSYISDRSNVPVG